MEIKADHHKIIIACNKQGLVQELYLDTALLLNGIILPVGLHTLFASNSLKDLGVFWLSIINNKIEENHVLTLGCNERQLTYVFSGYLLGDKVLLTGNTELSAPATALDELMKISNEQVNKLRLSEKEIFNLKVKSRKPDNDNSILDDFSAINNELVNSKRELIRKSKRIELLNKELEALNDNLNNFTYSVSHDLREPLRMVKSFLGLLEKKYEANLDEKGKSYLKFATGGAKKLDEMFNALLEFHRTENAVNDEVVDLNLVLIEVRKTLKLMIDEKGAKIESSNLPLVKGSYTGYFQVFQNLISNAIKFTPEDRFPVIGISTELIDGQPTLIIKDNGLGIPKNQHENIFMIFKRLDNSQEQKGKGIGLALVKRNIEQMKGKIWLTSELDKGTIFYITLNTYEKP